ncbi:MAG: TetR/AcrR family transcriptional regulator [Nitrospinae bacterium]|nr:TetR/AcrR family transcriptional regulator [Nitrospinota bacterium]
MKNRIIEAAEKMFYQYGYRKVTMDDIASDLGISKKTLYQYFKSKDAIASAVVKRLHHDIERLQKKARKEISDPIERFEEVIAEISSRITRIGSAFMSDIKKDIPELWKRCEEFREKDINEYIEGILKEGIKKERIKEEINTKIALLAYLGAIRTVFQPEIFAENTFSIEEAFENIIKIFLKGIER